MEYGAPLSAAVRRYPAPPWRKRKKKCLSSLDFIGSSPESSARVADCAPHRKHQIPALSGQIPWPGAVRPDHDPEGPHAAGRHLRTTVEDGDARSRSDSESPALPVPATADASNSACLACPRLLPPERHDARPARTPRGLRISWDERLHGARPRCAPVVRISTTWP